LSIFTAPQKIIDWIEAIQPLDEVAMQDAQQRLHALTKPHGSLGKLETFAIQISGIRREPFPVLDRRAVVIMAADHGVCAENISAYPQEVTAQMVQNVLAGGAAVNGLAKAAGAHVCCIDIGVRSPLSHPNLVMEKVASGTANMTVAPAMTGSDMLRAITVGVETMQRLEATQTRLVAMGEMGIGNTTSAAALTSALLHLPVDQTVGTGTGIDETQWAHKKTVVQRTLQRHRPSDEPWDSLRHLGGLEIAGMVGLCLGAALTRTPLILDGYTTTVAALLAVRIAPAVRAFLFPSHVSVEPGHTHVLHALAMKPWIDAEMRLGEGTGALLAMPLLAATSSLFRGMATFEQAHVSRALHKENGHAP
jgi:nicotinate-nucleotide--dimethylbenzimidazole phosphoribosyltransferase